MGSEDTAAPPAFGTLLRCYRTAVGLTQEKLAERAEMSVGSSRVDLQACKLEYSIVSPK